jgi:hypothetical protein
LTAASAKLSTLRSQAEVLGEPIDATKRLEDDKLADYVQKTTFPTVVGGRWRHLSATVDPRFSSHDSEVFRRRLALLPDNAERDPLTLFESPPPEPFDGRDVHEYILPTAFRLNESEAS